MGVLSNLEPKKVFYYFEEITKIPHGSGNVDKISNYLADFARERGLEVIQDSLKNIIIFKEASPGYEKEPAIILQGHMDMVAVKCPDYDIDMKTEGLRVGIDGDNIYAEGTSLGGDDGIAVAYALALLDSDDIKHPRLEIVLTVDEETGMDGAREIDLSMLKGSRLLNLDSEGEGIFLTSCAGGARVNCSLPLAWEKAQGKICELFVGGLLGGHSGEEIHKERGNSNKLFGRILWELSRACHVRLIYAEGGLADNAIPRETRAKLLFTEECGDCESILERVSEEISSELAVKDPDFLMNWQIADTQTEVNAVSETDTRKAAAMLVSLPDGVQNMSAEVPGLVETSLNLGILRLDEEGLNVEFAVRSSVESAKKALIGKILAVAGLADAKAEVNSDYPGWKYRADSPLREKMIRIYREMYGEAPKIEAIHAGLECGLLGNKIKDLDGVAIGPNMKDIHTTEETLSISSTGRVWEFLIKVLADKEND